ncbi:MAG: proliferating cell nuclear antigen (pcna) [Promethearchaeota archaeon]
MLKASIVDAKIWKGVVEAISTIIEETTINADEDGLKLTAFDQARICLIHLELKKDLFDSYECDESVKFRVTLEDLVKINKRASATDKITLIHDPKTNQLNIKMTREKPKSTRQFKLGLQKVESEEEKIDISDLNLELSGKVELDPGLFDEAIKDAEIYSDDLEIRVTPNKELVFATEGDMGEMQYELGEDSLFNIEVSGEANAKYAIQYLKKIFKIMAVSSSSVMEMGNQSPVRFNFKIEGKVNENPVEFGEIVYFLAPKVEGEDFDDGLGEEGYDDFGDEFDDDLDFDEEL